MSPNEEHMLEMWKQWLLEAVHRKFEDRKMSVQVLEEAQIYITELIELTFEDDPTFKEWKKNIRVETGMDEVTERPYYRIIWNEDYDN